MEPVIRMGLTLILNLEIWTFICTNLLCLYSIYKGKLYALKDNPVYLITGSNMIVDTLQLFIHSFYIAMADKIFSSTNYFVVTVLSVLFIQFWFVGSYIQIVMAINRFCIIVIPKSQIFTRKRVYIILLAVIISSSTMTIYAQFLSPCCRLIVNPNHIGYTFMPHNATETNISLLIFDFPIDVIATVISSSSYIAIFSHIYRLRRESKLDVTKQEIWACFHFLLIFLTYAISWMSFFGFPFLGLHDSEYFDALTIMMLIAYSGVNSMVYLCRNKEIQKNVKYNTIKSCWKSITAPSHILPSGLELPTRRHT